MTVGLPGAAIGGLFYVVSAVCAPPVAFVRWCVRRDAAAASDVRSALRQSAVAWGVVCVTVATGWAVTACVSHAASGPFGHGVAAPVTATMDWRHAVRMLAVLASFGTLLAVLLGVQLLRWLAPPAPTPLPHRLSATTTNASPAHLFGVLVLVVVCITTVPQPAYAATAAACVAAADSALAAHDLAAAQRLYGAALQIDAGCSRALFQQARLAATDAEACIWLRRYVTAQPDDAWGWMALGDHAAHLGHAAEANAAYRRAVQLVPQERDAQVGLARVQDRTGRTDDAIRTYEQWLERHPQDVEAASELARAQRHAGQLRAAAHTLEQIPVRDDRMTAALERLQSEAAPTFEPFVQQTADSDHNHRLRFGAASEISLANGGQVGIVGSRVRVSYLSAERDLDGLAIRLGWRPRATLRLEAAPGVTRVAAVARGDALVRRGLPAQDHLVGSARARWRAATRAVGFDAGVRREFMDASVTLLDARVLRTESHARLDVPLVGRLSARGGGRWSRYESTARNARRQWSGALVLKPGATNEWSLALQEARFDHAAVEGYFAPERVQSLEFGSYAEGELGSRLSWMLDLGAGMDRIQAFGAQPGAWDPAFRGSMQLSVALQPGCALRFEAEADDSQASAESSLARGWHYGFAAASLRWALH